MKQRTDTVIVGAGPIGIELAVALQKSGVETIHLEAGIVGSTISWYAPQTHFFSSPERIAIAGVPLQTLDQSKATREEYLQYLRGVVRQFQLPIRFGHRVTGVARSADGLVVEVASSRDGYSIAARNVVLAIGDMHAPRRLGIEGEDLPHVSHYFREPHFYFGKRVLIVGGKNSAVEAAIRCHRVGAEVAISYRGDDFSENHIKFWLLPEIRSMIRDGRIAFFPRTFVRRITASQVMLDSAGELRVVDADEVLLLTGYVQDASLFRSAGVELEGEQQRPRLSPETMETNVPGVYAAGTAVAGTQLGGVKEFIETSHVHVDRIVAAITGKAERIAPPLYELPEA